MLLFIRYNFIPKIRPVLLVGADFFAHFTYTATDWLACIFNLENISKIT